MPPPPPPPPGAPPPTFNLANTQKPKLTKSEGNTRSALLSSIEQGKRLKSAKHLMVDKSGPAVAGGASNKNKFKTMPANQPNPVRGGGFTPGGNRNVARNVTAKSTPAPPVPSGNVSQNSSPTVPKMPGQRDYSGGATVGRVEGGNVQGPPALAGLFAGGMPALRKTGNRMETGGGNSAVAPPPPRSAPCCFKACWEEVAPCEYEQRPNATAARNIVPPPPPPQGNHIGRNNVPPPPPQGNHVGRNNVPPPPPHQNKPRLGVPANNGHVVNNSGNIHSGPPPPSPNMAGRSKPATPSPSRPPPLGSRGGHPPPPPPNRAPPATPVSNGPMQQRKSPGLGNRPMPPVPSLSLPSRGTQPPPPPPHRTNNQPGGVPPPPPPARSPMTKVQAPFSTPPPPPPPSRGPAMRPTSAGVRNNHGNMNGTHPPPPPSRTCPRTSGGPGNLYDKDFERQFKFTEIDKLPLPQKFIQSPKTYPSQNTKNPANRRNMPPPPVHR
ncbi:hypothetical protein LSAT2_018123 [Lamellibrachia satsuma]|nr:hypothetical protein LSAT2_018123 [Lamellibrachia satsuma]